MKLPSPPYHFEELFSLLESWKKSHTDCERPTLSISQITSHEPLSHVLPLMAMSTFLLSLPPHHQKPPQNPISRNPILPRGPNVALSRRLLIFTTTSLSSVLSLALQCHHIPISSAAETPSPSSVLSAIVNTKSWYQFYGDGFAIRVPPEFQDILEPEVWIIQILCWIVHKDLFFFIELAA